MAFTKKIAPATKKPVKPAATKPAAAAPAAKRAPAKKLTNEQRATLKQFEAPVDFKAAVVEIDFRTAHDGMISPASLIVSRVKGSATNDDAPRLNMFEYDALTASAIVARLSAVVHATNFFKRLPANRRFFVVLRAGKSKDGFLTCSIKSVSILVKKEWVELTRETEQATYLNAFKKIKRAAVPLRGAFVTCQLPPSKRRTKEQADD